MKRSDEDDHGPLLMHGEGLSYYMRDVLGIAVHGATHVWTPFTKHVQTLADAFRAFNPRVA